MNCETLLIDQPLEGILSVTIDRPKSLNALSSSVLEELKAFFLSLNNREEIRGIILKSSGDRAFIAGADIKEMSIMNLEERESFAQLGQEATLAIENSPVPVIACVDGFALGGGCEIAMSCDFIYATEAAVFGQPEITLGLIACFGGCIRLVEKVGPSVAKEIILTNRKITAKEALKLNLVNQVFATKDELFEAAYTCMKRILNLSPNAIKLSKEVINLSQLELLSNGLKLERQKFREASTHRDSLIGIEAFLTKSDPKF